MSLLETPENPEENVYLGDSAAPGAARSAAVDAQNGLIDAGLLMVIEHWPTLSDEVRRDILTMIRAAGDVD